MTCVIVTEGPNCSVRRPHIIDNTRVIKLVTNEQVTTRLGMVVAFLLKPSLRQMQSSFPKNLTTMLSTSLCKATVPAADQLKKQ
eukprot:10121637-Ditylum_brightwellii.AAC.1